MIIGMSEINKMLKENFQRQLQDIKDLPEDLAIGYKKWVRGLVSEASQQLNQENAPQVQQEEPAA